MFQNDDIKKLTLPDNVLQALPSSVQDYINFLLIQIQQQKQEYENRIKSLETKLQELEARLAKDSSNSNKPPSSDGFKKPFRTTSQRVTSGKKPGGQPGRIGKTLRQISNPDHVVLHNSKICNACGHSLSGVEVTRVEKRQVFEIPKPKMEVTEHQVEVKRCSRCGQISKGIFPNDVTAAVQYGKRIKALASYFTHQHFVPIKRACQIFEDVFSIALSPGTCANIDRNLFITLAPFETRLKAGLIASKVLHFDETGIRRDRKLNWIHVASSSKATFYGIHNKRGQEGIDEFEVLSKFKKIAVHDHWSAYFKYLNVEHSLCNAHHLRELTYIGDHEREDWANKMRKLLLKAKQLAEEYKPTGSVPKSKVSMIKRAYRKILNEGFYYHKNLSALPRKQRGRQKQRVGKNLLDRLKNDSKCVLRFLHDLEVPFTNNQGEQDIRMVKLKEKISGCFRTVRGGEIFCRVRSYLSTARKQKWDILDSLIDALNGNSRLLPISPS